MYPKGKGKHPLKKREKSFKKENTLFFKGCFPRVFPLGYEWFLKKFILGKREKGKGKKVAGYFLFFFF